MCFFSCLLYNFIHHHMIICEWRGHFRIFLCMYIVHMHVFCLLYTFFWCFLNCGKCDRLTSSSSAGPRCFNQRCASSLIECMRRTTASFCVHPSCPWITTLILFFCSSSKNEYRIVTIFMSAEASLNFFIKVYNFSSFFWKTHQNKQKYVRIFILIHIIPLYFRMYT